MYIFVCSVILLQYYVYGHWFYVYSLVIIIAMIAQVLADFLNS